jgi:hypothetical protein
MFALLHLMHTNYEIPSTFDGDMPELQGSEGPPSLQFGHWCGILISDGREVSGRLYDAIVMEDTKQVFGQYQLATGEYTNATCPITDGELATYRHYPETFFGEVRRPTRHAKTLMDWCDFFYESYKDAPREKLLEWMAGAPDIERLRSFPKRILPSPSASDGLGVPSILESKNKHRIEI